MAICASTDISLEAAGCTVERSQDIVTYSGTEIFSYATSHQAVTGRQRGTGR